MKIEIVYDKKKGVLKFKNKDGKYVDIRHFYSSSDELSNFESIKERYDFEFISEAYAEEVTDNELLFDALESDDSYIRESASRYIVKHINELYTTIEKKLLSKELSLISKIVIMTALARASSPDLKESRQWQLSNRANTVIYGFILSKNHALKAQTKRYLVRNISEKHLKSVTNICNRKDVGMENRQYCPYLHMDLLYNLAIRKWSDSMDGAPDKKIAYIKDGIKLIEINSQFSGRTKDNLRIKFAKLYYGKAFLTHELSKLQKQEKDVNHFREVAIEHFKDMIILFADVDQSSYEYPHHIQQAKCYIKSPSQKCFEEFNP